jgi:hypothetical protein
VQRRVELVPCCSTTCLNVHVSQRPDPRTFRKLTAVDEKIALVIVRPDDLTLVDLPEDTLFLAQILCVQTLFLPALAIPVLVCRQIGGSLIIDTSQVYPVIALSMTIGIDVAVRADSSDIPIPWLSVAIPPVLPETVDGQSGRLSIGIEADRGDTGSLDVVDTARAMIEEEVQDT